MLPLLNKIYDVSGLDLSRLHANSRILDMSLGDGGDITVEHAGRSFVAGAVDGGQLQERESFKKRAGCVLVAMEI